ncbi:SpaH/EbpB family LPXTG-anchored major pilin [Leucobacter luti]|uniref:LPXTG-motif cell wall-anchored protein/fimbrial isopeptide formation D2 family protein n=1 Tax=Leucobacter luti TaxID=340320 RepID=A0A4Q7TYP2_9MICO|nr:SpaH/EbpB family LPXTG-anchored major pilin [Leucobacter luti]MBL3698876.1 isopeptide-forming domain-containing fimbrial protein [Leucobacter luti]RZT66255.1 LPXTG-motif cell wall-anchored protein/fimbrial isopeptide formation D2 family protein [Leucobacter luti]
MRNTGRGGTPNRALAALAAAAIALLGAVAASTPAVAAPTYGSIDVSAPGSIIVHKHEHQTGTSPVTQNPDGTGTAIPTPGIAGVEFTAAPLLQDGEPVDLNDPAAWDALQGLEPGADCTAPAGYTLGTALAPVTTNADGTATIPTSVGVYVVCETAAPANVVDRAAPFIVTIPYPYEDGWLYDVNVYPKNGVTSIVKTITPQSGLGFGLGSVIEFPVTATIPTLALGRSFTGFDVLDTLDPRLTPTAASAGVGLGVKSVTVGGVAVPAANYAVTGSGQSVQVAFTPAAGYAWLAARTGQQVVVTFQGTVTSLGNGTITNTASDFVNDPNHRSAITSNTVSSNWGDLVIEKVNSRTPGDTLAGAKFEVYAAADPYAADCSTATVSGSRVAVSGASEFTTGANGRITVAGLFVSDSVNAPTNASQRCYVIKEIAAPAGYVTPTGAAALTPVTVHTGATTDVDVTVKNVQQDGPELPLTGSSGALILSIAGGALLIAAAGAALIVARRRSHRVE